MKFPSLFEPRTERLGVNVKLRDLIKIIDEGDKKFYFKWLTDNRFVISLNFSFGSHLLFDINRPNTKSEIIFYGQLTEIDESTVEINLKTRSKYIFAILLVVLPLFILVFLIVTQIEFPLFFAAPIFFILVIIGSLNLIRSEENRLLMMFKEYLDNRILLYYDDK